jgi:hypothetical protein
MDDKTARTISLLRDVVVRRFLFDAMEFNTFMYRRLDDDEYRALLTYAREAKVQASADDEDTIVCDALEHLFEEIGGEIMGGLANWAPTTHEIDAYSSLAPGSDGVEEGMQAQLDSFDFCKAWMDREPVRDELP